MDFRRAVYSTVTYADYFHFPLTPEEIFFWLIGSRIVTFSNLRTYLPQPLTSSEKAHRRKISLISQTKLQHSQKLASLLRFLPGLRLVAVSGSVAANNAQSGDDIDLFIVTSPHTLWLLRPFVLLLLSLFFQRRHPGEKHDHAPNAFCPNLWLDSSALRLSPEKHNLYTAHEILQIKPILNKDDAYQSFLKANSWTKKYLANAYSTLTSTKEPSSRPKWRDLPPLFIFLLAPLNLLFFFFQFIYMSPKKTTEIVNLHTAFLHTADFDSALVKHFLKHQPQNWL